jgi:hypothetical protein
MVKKFIKKYKTSLPIKVLQKTTLNFLCIPVRMAIIKKTISGKNVGWWEVKTGHPP